MITRRTLLLSGAGVLATAGATLPLGHDDATLAADVDVLDVGFVTVDEPGHDREVQSITVEIDVSEAGEPVEPLVFVWGQYHWLMQAWDQVSGPDRVLPGETVSLEVSAPGPKTRVYATVLAQATIVDAGTEARAKTSFVPVEVADGHE